MKDIDEMIADAKAEEQVAKEQEKAAKEQAQREDFKQRIAEKLTAKKENTKVTINLEEYTTLKLKERDLERLLNAIINDLELNYCGDGLRLKDDVLLDAFRVIYPEAYDITLAALQMKEGD